jgi:hypothetical protein
MPSHNTADFRGFDKAFGGFDTFDAIPLAAQTSDFTILDDIDP